MKRLTDHVVFNDKKLARKYANARIPMSTLYEAYFDGGIDIPGDMRALLRDRDLFVKYTLTPLHFKWAVTNFVPEVAIHSKKQDERIVRAEPHDGLDIDSFRFDKSPDATRHIHIDDHRNAGRRVSRDFRAADGAVTA